MNRKKQLYGFRTYEYDEEQNNKRSEQFQNPIENHMKGGKIGTPTTYIHNFTLFWFGTGTSIKSGGVCTKDFFYSLGMLRKNVDIKSHYK
jgi:hypothetical protein